MRLKNLLIAIEEINKKLIELDFNEQHRVEIIKEFIRNQKNKKVPKKAPRKDCVDYLIEKQAK